MCNKLYFKCVLIRVCAGVCAVLWPINKYHAVWAWLTDFSIKWWACCTTSQVFREVSMWCGGHQVTLSEFVVHVGGVNILQWIQWSGTKKTEFSFDIFGKYGGHTILCLFWVKLLRHAILWLGEILTTLDFFGELLTTMTFCELWMTHYTMTFHQKTVTKISTKMS